LENGYENAKKNWERPDTAKMKRDRKRNRKAKKRIRKQKRKKKFRQNGYEKENVKKLGKTDTKRKHKEHFLGNGYAICRFFKNPPLRPPRKAGPF